MRTPAGRSLTPDSHETFIYISQVEWRYAKTMPDWPHEYTIKAWRPDLAEQFEAMSQLIQDEGWIEPWPPPPADVIYRNRYLVVGNYKYWAMGPSGDQDPVSEMTVINPCDCVDTEGHVNNVLLVAGARPSCEGTHLGASIARACSYLAVSRSRWLTGSTRSSFRGSPLLATSASSFKRRADSKARHAPWVAVLQDSLLRRTTAT